MQNVTMLGMVLLDRTEEESQTTVNRFLRNSALNVVTYVDYASLLRADRDETVREFLTNSAMTLWADKEILEISGIVDSKRSREISDRVFLKNLLDGIAESGSKVALAGINSESIEKLRGELLSVSPNLMIIHEALIENPGNQIPEDVINGINEHAPAMIISRMDYQLLNTWLKQSKAMVNAGIWLAIPELMSLVDNNEKGIIKKLVRHIRYMILKRRTKKMTEGQYDIKSNPSEHN